MSRYAAGQLDSFWAGEPYSMHRLVLDLSSRTVTAAQDRQRRLGRCMEPWRRGLRTANSRRDDEIHESEDDASYVDERDEYGCSVSAAVRIRLALVSVTVGRRGNASSTPTSLTSGTLSLSLKRPIVASTFKPTAEQEAVVMAARSSDDLKVKAYAGAGKTSTLRLVAHQLTGRRGSYLAFNKEIANSARRGFPANVTARTVHSLAYAGVSSRLTARINLPSEPPHELAARYGLGAIEVHTITGKTVEITSFEIGRMISEGLGRFCRSSDDTPQPFHVPVDEKVREGCC